MSSENETFPSELGVMALPGAILFPNALLPLYIFEPRYRLMLERALAGDRMFAVAMTRDDVGSEVFGVGGAGLIRASVVNADGTSHLILQGTQRVRFVEWLQVEPYRIARVLPMLSENSEQPEAAELAREVRDLCQELLTGEIELPKYFEDYLAQVDNPEVFSDVICSTLVSDAAQRQRLLQELDVPARLRLLLGNLRAQLRNG